MVGIGVGVGPESKCHFPSRARRQSKGSGGHAVQDSWRIYYRDAVVAALNAAHGGLVNGEIKNDLLGQRGGNIEIKKRDA